MTQTFNVALFEIEPDNPVATCLLALLIVLYEWMGGLASVAYTDAVQGVVMILLAGLGDAYSEELK